MSVFQTINFSEDILNPRGLTSESGKSPKKISDIDAPFQFVEAYKSLRTNLDFISVDKEYHTLLITSSIPKEGKSGIAINLSITLAETGKRVMLVDADLRKPMLSHYLEVISSKVKGLSNVLTGIDLSSCIFTLPKFHFDLLLAGDIPPNPAELLGSNKMADIVKELKTKYDYVIFDTPPVSVLTDAAILCRYIDGVILVIRQKSASIDQVLLAKKNLQSVNANIIGAILNDFDILKAPQKNIYHRNYYYKYSNYK
ncbi:MAG: CpsD/CapB family tyrosine-protein kinase [Flexilinea sp.]